MPPQTVRISQEAYRVIEKHKDENQSFREVVDEMVEMIGWNEKTGQSELSDIERTLRDKYKYDDDTVDRVLEALRVVYTGRYSVPGRPGIPTDHVQQDYPDETDTLQRLDLIELEHAGGTSTYDVTERGEGAGKESVNRELNSREEEISELVQEYGASLFAFLLSFGTKTFNESDSAYRTIAGSYLYETDDEYWWEDDQIEDIYQDFRDDLLALDIAIAVPDSIPKFNESGEDVAGHDDGIILPPEFHEFLVDSADVEDETFTTMELYRTLLDYAFSPDLNTRKELKQELIHANMDQLGAELDDLSERGLTSPLLDEDPPILIRDRAGLVERIQNIALRDSEVEL